MRGCSRIRLASTLTISQPPRCASCTAWRTKRSLAAPCHRGSLLAKCVPISPSPSAPRIASQMACSSTSPSLCPARPWPWAISTPPSHSRRCGSKMCESQPVPTRYSNPMGDGLAATCRSGRLGALALFLLRLLFPDLLEQLGLALLLLLQPLLQLRHRRWHITVDLGRQQLLLTLDVEFVRSEHNIG